MQVKESHANCLLINFVNVHIPPNLLLKQEVNLI